MSRRGRPRPAPLPEEGTVAGLTHDGAGILRGEGKAVFVPGALPGERVRFLRRGHHRQHDEGELQEVLEPSPDRVAARCAHFGLCGGCSLQHMSPEAQLAAKQRELGDSLARIGRIEPQSWLEPVRGPVWGYRRRARLGAKFVTRRGRVLVGFRERAKPYVAALARCEILAPPVDALIEPLSDLLTGLQRGNAIPQIEVAVAENATVLVFRVLEPLPDADLEALAAFERTHGVRVCLQPGGLDTIRPLAGEPEALRYTLPAEGLAFEFLPSDFVQVNSQTNRALVARALELLDPGPADRVLDLFCGLGNFTLPIARRARQVIGVEGEPGLVARARDNARRNGIDNASFHVANLADPEVARLPGLAGPFTRVLLDPPRAGALEVLPRVAALAPARIVYVSCHPGTLARDVGLLCTEHGYALSAAGVVDMFPHTNHVESLAVLDRAAGRR